MIKIKIIQTIQPSLKNNNYICFYKHINLKKMITEKEYLNALEIVKKYKLQLKANKQKHVSKIDLVLRSMDNKKIIAMFGFKFSEAEFFRYSSMIIIIQKVYFANFNKRIGRNNSIKLLDKLIERGVIYVTGDFGFSEYRLKK